MCARVCVCVYQGCEYERELIADDSILYRQSGVMLLDHCCRSARAGKITLIEAVQIILLKVILQNDNQGTDLLQRRSSII